MRNKVEERPHGFYLHIDHKKSTFYFDCGSENQVNEWVQHCNYWAACESKMPTINHWRPAGATFLNKKEQRLDIQNYLDHLSKMQEPLTLQQVKY
jgi:hypothetical protein